MNSRLNRIYCQMKQRCYNPKDSSYKNYGARGIGICDEWKSWEVFKCWALENGYTDEKSIDRIDSNGWYEPGNCRWTTRKEQNNNTRRNRYITYRNKTQTLAQWCEELNLDYLTVFKRIEYRHWSIEKAFETKESMSIRRITYKGQTKSVVDWCNTLGLKYTTVLARIDRLGWSVEKAFEYN